MQKRKLKDYPRYDEIKNSIIESFNCLDIDTETREEDIIDSILESMHWESVVIYYNEAKKFIGNDYQFILETVKSDSDKIYLDVNGSIDICTLVYDYRDIVFYDLICEENLIECLILNKLEENK